MVEIKLKSDKEFINNFILQRTGAFLELGGGAAFQEWQRSGRKNQLTDFLLQNNLTQEFLKKTLSQMSAEAKSIISTFALDKKLLTKIVSIGPGNGLLELFLVRGLNDLAKEKKINQVVLIDVEETDTHEHNFRESGSGYASLQATKEFLELNEIGVDISLVNPKHQTLPPSDFQMCCSFLSMGFHYPCNEYEEFILNASPGSMFLFDKRLGAPDPGFENVMKQYKIVGKINNGKASRLGLIKSDGSGEPSNV